MRDLTRGGLISVGVALIVVAAASAVSLLAPPTLAPSITTEEFSAADVVMEPIPAQGEIRSNATAGDRSGVVVIDDAHGNEIDRAAVQPLIEELETQGYDVRFHTEDGLADALEDADAFVVIDPTERYTRIQLDELDAFVEDGGRLLILGEPTQYSVSFSLLGASITKTESALTTLGARFDLVFDTRYVYDQRRNDGNYKRPLVRANENASLSAVRENLSAIGTVSLYTAAPVRSTRNGTTVLETYPSARIADSDVDGPVPVAIRDGNVLAIGDSTFVGVETYNVASNEAFLERVVEFLIGGDRDTEPA